MRVMKPKALFFMLPMVLAACDGDSKDTGVTVDVDADADVNELTPDSAAILLMLRIWTSRPIASSSACMVLRYPNWDRQ